MPNSFTRSLAEATRLTRAGKLQEATTVIQSALRGRGGAAPTHRDGNYIETTWTRLDDSAPNAEAEAVAPKARRPLSETLRDLGQRRTRRKSPAEELPAGARFIEGVHNSQHGTRSYRVYIPGRQSVKPMPIVMMLHGCTQSAEDFAAGTGMNALAEEFGFLVVYPEQSASANIQKCWNWFRASDQSRGAGEPALLAGIVREVLAQHAADGTRVFAAGLSAGGAAAAILGATYPEIFRAVGIHSGLAAGSASDASQAFTAMRGGARPAATKIPVPVIIFHGTADKTVHPVNADHLVTQALNGRSGLQRTETRGRSEGGRAFRRTRYGTTDSVQVDSWQIEGGGHAWSGGKAYGSYTDPEGPDASREMIRFFLAQSGNN